MEPIGSVELGAEETEGRELLRSPGLAPLRAGPGMPEEFGEEKDEAKAEEVEAKAGEAAPLSTSSTRRPSPSFSAPPLPMWPVAVHGGDAVKINLSSHARAHHEL